MRDIDLLIYAPHGNDDPSWIKKVLPHLNFEQPIPENLLRRYQSHEADRWSDEMAEALYSRLRLKRPEKRIEMLTGGVPRAWIDLNRPWVKAVPEAILPPSSFKEMYSKEIQKAITLHKRAKLVFHIHTMCGRQPRYVWSLDRKTRADDLEEFLLNCYSGDERSVDLLFKTDTGLSIGSPEMINSILSTYQENWYRITTHGTYILKDNYPATELLSLSQGCLIELPKSLLSTDASSHQVDTSQLILDIEKIEAHADILCEAVDHILT